MTTLDKLLQELSDNAEVRDHYATDPAAFLSSRGWADLDPEDLAEALQEQRAVGLDLDPDLSAVEPLIAGSEFPESWDFTVVEPATVAIEGPPQRVEVEVTPVDATSTVDDWHTDVDDLDDQLGDMLVSTDTTSGRLDDELDGLDELGETYDDPADDDLF